MQRFLKLNLYLWLGVVCAVLAGGAAVAQGQTPKPAPTPQKEAKPGGRDPFIDTTPKPKPAGTPKPAATPKIAVKPTKPVPTVIPPLDIAARINIYKAQKQEALLRQEAPPKPTTAFLIQELEVAGIFRTPRGYAAMVQAGPIKLSYIIYPGESVYDGQLVAIDEDHLVFRRRFKWTDGRDEVRVERKGLRPAALIADPLLAEKATPQAMSPAAGSAPAAPVVTPDPAVTPPAAPPVNPANLKNTMPPNNGKAGNGSQAAPEASEKPAETSAPKKTNPRTKGKTPAKPAAKPVSD